MYSEFLQPSSALKTPLNDVIFTIPLCGWRVSIGVVLLGVVIWPGLLRKIPVDAIEVG
jgi:hypothetical protein